MPNTQYRIKSGDSLSAIAHELLGSESSFRDIAIANALDIFAELPIGKIINLPAGLTIQNSTASVSPVSLDGMKQPETGNPFQLISWVL